MARAQKTGRGQLFNLHRDKEEASRGRRCEREERIYARLSVPVVRPRVANYRYITNFEYNDRTFIVCTLWRCFCGNKVSKPKSHQQTNCQKKHASLEKFWPLALPDSWSYLINQGFDRSNNLYSPFINMYLNFFTSIQLLFGSKDGQSWSDISSSFIKASLCWLLKRTLDLQNYPSLNSHQNYN